MDELVRLPAAGAAPLLLGWRLVRESPEGLTAGMIVETEAYHQDDPASHSYKRPTERTRVMFGPPGLAYVYFTYGMHWCVNVVCGPEGRGEAVLIRALEPLEGLDLMRERRGGVTEGQLTNGPAKLAKALAIDKSLNGHNLRQPPLQLLPPERVIKPDQIVTGPRIGISTAVDVEARFYLNNNPFVSIMRL